MLQVVVCQVLRLFYLFLLAALFCSCAEQYSHQNHQQLEMTVPVVVSDSLRFSSGITAIFQDQKGNYWLGSHQEGLASYDGQTFTYFTEKNGLLDNQIQSIQEDDQGIIWIATTNGISRLKDKKITSLAIQEICQDQRKWEMTKQDLWFPAGNNPGVVRFDGQALTYLPFPNLMVTNPNNVYFVTSISRGANHRIWIGTYAGVFGFNGTTIIPINDQSLGFQKPGEYLHVRSVLEDQQGRLWIGNNGIGTLLHQANSTINFSEQMGLIHPASTRMGDLSPAGTLEHVFVIAEDHLGNIWFSDRDTGLWRYDGNTMTIFSEKHGFPKQFILSIYQDDHDLLWFGSSEGKVFNFDGNQFYQPFKK